MSKRKLASNLILFLFFILVSVAALFSDIFQNPLKTGSQFVEQAKVFSQNELESINRLSFKNKSGEFTFERNVNNQKSPWHMVSPRAVSTNSIFIEKLFDSLGTIKIKKVFPEEKINLSNFSIDKPTTLLNLYDKKGKILTITVGLMNSIDNTTYLKISQRPGIFHSEAPSLSLENATILDLTESQIFSITSEKINSFKIYLGNKKSDKAQLELIKKNGAWQNGVGEAIVITKIDDFLQELSKLKSSFILDKQTETQKKQTSLLSKNSQYILSIEDNKGTTTDYSVSALIKSLSDIDLKGEEYFIIDQFNSGTCYIVKKEFFEIFNTKLESLGKTHKN